MLNARDTLDMIDACVCVLIQLLRVCFLTYQQLES